jgi:outer membrane protein assembly factor BamB
VLSYSAKTGEKLWSSRGLTWQVKSSAIVVGDTTYAAGAAPGADAGQRQQLLSYEEAVQKGDANGDKKISEQEAIDNGWRHKGGWGLVDLDDDGLLNQRDWEFFRARRGAHNTTVAIRPPRGARGDVTEKAVLWKYEKAVPVVSSPLLYQGVLYTIKDGGILTAFDPETGTVVKQGRLQVAIDTYFSSPVAADGKIYVISQAGKVSVVKPGADWETLAVNDLGEECFGTPAIGDGKLYVRTAGALYAFADGK